MKFSKIRKMRSQGFTLLELFVVLIIIGITSAITLPNVLEYIVKNNLKQDVTASAQVLKGAQSRAKTRSMNVSVAFTSTGLSSFETANTSNVFDSFDFTDGVSYSTAVGLSTITFDYKGQPILGVSNTDPTAFTASNGQARLCGASNICRNIYIAPITGGVTTD